MRTLFDAYGRTALTPAYLGALAPRKPLSKARKARNAVWCAAAGHPVPAPEPKVTRRAAERANEIDRRLASASATVPAGARTRGMRSVGRKRT